MLHGPLLDVAGDSVRELFIERKRRAHPLLPGDQLHNHHQPERDNAQPCDPVHSFHTSPARPHAVGTKPPARIKKP